MDSSFPMWRVDQLLARVDAVLTEHLPGGPVTQPFEPDSVDLGAELVSAPTPITVNNYVAMPDNQCALKDAVLLAASQGLTDSNQITELAHAFYMFLLAPAGPAADQPGVAAADPLVAGNPLAGTMSGGTTPGFVPDPASLGAEPLSGGVTSDQPVYMGDDAAEAPAEAPDVPGDVPGSAAPAPE